MDCIYTTSHVDAVRKDGAGLLAIVIVSQQAELLSTFNAVNLVPKRLDHQGTVSVCEFCKLFTEASCHRLDQQTRQASVQKHTCDQVFRVVSLYAIVVSVAANLRFGKNLHITRDLSSLCAGHLPDELKKHHDI